MKKILCIVLAFLLGCTCIQAVYRGEENTTPPTFSGLMAYCAAFEVIDVQVLLDAVLDMVEGSLEIPGLKLPQSDDLTSNDALDVLAFFEAVLDYIWDFLNWIGAHLAVGFTLLAYPLVVVVTVGQFITNILLYVFGFADVPKVILPPFGSV